MDPVAAALARLYDLDLAVDPGDMDLYLALAARTGGPIVELCAGTGRIANPLAIAGHDVVAVDRDPAMLERARQRASAGRPASGGRLTFIEGDLFTAPIPDAGTYRLAILGLNSLLLLGGPRRQCRAVEILAGLVAPGGIVVIDAWQPLPEDLVRFDGRLGLEWVRRDPDTGLDTTKSAAAWYDPAARSVTLASLFDEGRPGAPTVRWIREDSLHLTSADELRTWVEDAGLDVEAIASDYDLATLGPGDGRTIVVARRPDGP